MSYCYEYPRPAVTSDIIVMTREERPRVLLIQRRFNPFKDCWAFPGGFLEMTETIEECAARELQEETGLKLKSFTEVGVFSAIDRDPRGRTITVAFLAIVDTPQEAVGHDDAATAQWFFINQLPPLAFDHDVIMQAATKLYREKRKI